MRVNRTLFNTIVAALIATAGFAMAESQVPGQRGPGGGPGGRGFGGRGAAGFARFADLTDEQRNQVEAILQEERASREGPPASVALHRQLQAEILADAPDDQKIEALRQQLVQAQGEELARQIALERKLAQVLTPEQRAKVRERLAEAPRGRGERVGRPGPRPQAF